MSSAGSVVLLVTHTQDHFTVERVADALVRRGADPVRFDTDLYPSEVRLSTVVDERGPRYFMEAGGRSISAGDIQAVWTRKVWAPRLAEDLDPRFREACVRESRAALLGFLVGLRGVRCVNDLDRAMRSEDKLLQLRMARGAGLRVPRTLVTNDGERARSFYHELGGAMVAKMMTPFSVSMGKPSAFVYTSDVGEEDLGDAGQLRHCPMMFQERIEKARELRVAYVGGKVFSGSVDASRSAEGGTDWRLASPDECRWQSAELPDEVTEKLDVLMDRLGLAFGAIDLIVTPEGDHVFLEVNSAGEWGMLERDLGHPISEAIAEALLEGVSAGR